MQRTQIDPNPDTG